MHGPKEDAIIISVGVMGIHNLSLLGSPKTAPEEDMPSFVAPCFTTDAGSFARARLSKERSTAGKGLYLENVQQLRKQKVKDP